MFNKENVEEIIQIYGKKDDNSINFDAAQVNRMNKDENVRDIKIKNEKRKFCCFKC